jgi:hypothetical protein
MAGWRAALRVRCAVSRLSSSRDCCPRTGKITHNFSFVSQALHVGSPLRASLISIASSSVLLHSRGASARAHVEPPQ